MAAVVIVLLLSGVSLASGQVALAQVNASPLSGNVVQVQAWNSRGKPIPVTFSENRVTPLVKLSPGEQVTVRVKVKRPGWLHFVLGSEQVEQVTLHAPVAQVAQPVLTVAHGSAVRVDFDSPVAAVAYGSIGDLRDRALSAPASSVSVGAQAPTGTLEVSAAPRRWERLGAPTRVSWFPPAHEPVLASLPAAGTDTSPAGSIYLTFSRPVEQVLGESRPRVSPATPGTWREIDGHTLVFTPKGFGAPMGSELSMKFPHPVAVSVGSGLQVTREVHWVVPVGSTLRMQQLLAQAGYLPLEWRADGAEVRHTPSAELQASVFPPKGTFSWRYANTPRPLEGLWSAGQANVITRGAIMKFEDDHGMITDGEAGPAVWLALLHGAIARQRTSEPYSYVYVHRETPETATLWSAGRTVITTPANTGISGAETETGTFPVFEHIPEGTMSGTNPDGSKYVDPGIKWISYFNGGDALHYFDRASFGFPQSLGCVELPLAAAAEIWPYTPIGTLVTVET